MIEFFFTRFKKKKERKKTLAFSQGTASHKQIFKHTAHLGLGFPHVTILMTFILKFSSPKNPEGRCKAKCMLGPVQKPTQYPRHRICHQTLRLAPHRQFLPHPTSLFVSEVKLVLNQTNSFFLTQCKQILKIYYFTPGGGGFFVKISTSNRFPQHIPTNSF